MQVTSTLRQANKIRLRFQPGAQGPAGQIVSVEAETLPPGSEATVVNNGTTEAAELVFGIPEGLQGDPNTLTIGTVTTLPYGEDATAEITGDAPNQTLNLGLPMGEQGPSGSVTDGDKGDIVVSGGGTEWNLDPAVQASNDARYHSIPSGLGLNNRLINGAMRVSQRGTSFNANGYTLDHWGIQFGAGGAGTVAQNPIVGDDLAFSLLWTQTTGGTSPYLYQTIEDVRSMAGKRVCLSFGAAILSGTTTITPRLVQKFGTGGSPSADVTTLGTPITLTGGRVFQFLTLPSIVGKSLGTNGDSYLGLELVADTGATFTVSLSDGQLEEVPAAATGPTPFERIPLGFELALCYRYYQRVPSQRFVSYGATTPAVMETSFPLLVPMRSAPSVVINTAPTTPSATALTITATKFSYKVSLTMINPAGQYAMESDGVFSFSAEF